MGKNINGDTSFLTSWIHFASCKPLRLESTPPNKSEKVGVRSGGSYSTTATMCFSFSDTTGTLPGLLCLRTFVSLEKEKKKKKQLGYSKDETNEC